ncbi:hypothetical protein QTQ03_05850 [Micromonospora sp. WMMA1363]|uniref:hypothetical protein n=1 Tax=Micromonospora sp. WMMA1363 TaxID=3053985 RepID=UPI00259CB473|nr:hypothetical protein [Micromonospora sp. WMMA1363]MDM4719143.1 hypothetical protein [Micromonospora sp. WMMA1363]
MISHDSLNRYHRDDPNWQRSSGVRPWWLCHDPLVMNSAVRVWAAALVLPLSLVACADRPGLAGAEPTPPVYRLVDDLCAKLDPKHLTDLGNGESKVRNKPDRPDRSMRSCSLGAVNRDPVSLYKVDVTTRIFEGPDQEADELRNWPGPKARGDWRDVPELNGSARVWILPIDNLTDPPSPFTGPIQSRQTWLRAVHDGASILVRLDFTAERVPDDTTTETVAVAYVRQVLALMAQP